VDDYRSGTRRRSGRRFSGPRESALRIVTTYAVVATAWIFLTDIVSRAVTIDPNRLTEVAVAKGVLFVAVTSSLLFVQIRNDFARLQEAAQRLRESEERYASVAEQGGVVTMETDAEGLFTFVSPVSRHVVGYRPEELVGTLHYYDLFPGEGRADLVAALRQGLQERGELKDYVDVARDKDGRSVWISASVQPIRDADGHLLGYRGSLMDVTQRIEDKELRDQALRATLEVLDGVVEARDPYTVGHEKRVSDLAIAIAGEMGRPPAEIESVRLAGLIHDVGKLTVPSELLTKPGVLSPAELTLVRSHAQASYDLVSKAQMPRAVTEIVHQHHERCDGSGYPRGLHHDEILPGAKVLMVADAVEAMASHRPYRASLGIDEALAQIEQGSGTLYDTEVVDACLRLFRDRGFALLED